ncbi:MAG: ATP-binding protein [Acidimicrobiia bacterium]|nr:ATP-binding protein [Acidimicrobiia bacterium]
MRSVDHHLSADLDAPARSRRLVAASMGTHPRKEDAVLAVSEIVANAVVHGAPSDGGLILRLGTDPSRLRVEITHAGVPFDPAVDRAFHGLGMVDQVVDRWGIDGPGDNRVTVWFEIDLT